MDVSLWGARGRSWMPAAFEAPQAALEVAVVELMSVVEFGAVEHPCNARFGRDIVHVLASAEEQLAAR